MEDKHSGPENEEWDDILQHLRQVRQQIKEQGPLPEAEKAEVTMAFHRGLALLEGQARDMRGHLKGSSGKW